MPFRTRNDERVKTISLNPSGRERILSNSEELPLATMVKVPQARDLLWPTVRALKVLGGSASIREIDAKVVELENFTEEQTSALHKGGPQTELSYELHWARSLLKMAGALENQRGSGVWSLSRRGSQLPEADIPRVLAAVRKARARPVKAVVDTDPEASAAAAPMVADVWQEQLLRVLVSMPASAFERLCQRLLRESGFTSVEVTGRSGDGGVDGVGVLRINLVSFRVFFQCKRYRGSVGAGAVRDFRGAMAGRAEKGLLMTTGSFTSEAQREATRDGAPPIDLIDGQELCALLKAYQLGLTTRQVEEVQIDTRWFAQL